MRCADNLIGGQPFQTDKDRVIQDALELVDTLQKAADRILVPDFLRNDIPPAEDGEIAPATAALPSRLSDEQVRKLNEELENKILEECPPYNLEELNPNSILEESICKYLLQLKDPIKKLQLSINIHFIKIIFTILPILIFMVSIYPI